MFNRKNRTFFRHLESNLINHFISFQEGEEVEDMLAYGVACQEVARGPLAIYSGKVNGPTYIKLIEEALPKFIENTFNSSNKQWVFIQNNASLHRSAYSIKWFKNSSFNPVHSLRRPERIFQDPESQRSWQVSSRILCQILTVFISRIC